MIPITIKNVPREKKILLAFGALAVLALTTFCPQGLAYADALDDFNGFICGVLRDVCNDMFQNQAEFLKSISANGILSAPFEQMLGAAGGASVYGMAKTMWNVAIVPIGCGVLSLVFTLKLIEISQRMDGNQSMPGIKETIFLLVFFAVFLFLIQHSFEIMAAIYEVIGLAIDRTSAAFGTGGIIDISAMTVAPDEDDMAVLIGLVLVSILGWLFVLVAYCVTFVVSWTRALTLYIMAAFAPIPLALMGNDQTRSVGIGYLKNFVAQCVAGLIILFILIAFPVVLNAVTGASGNEVIDQYAAGFSYFLQYIAVSLMLILALVKSGNLAREIVGS